MTNDEIYKSWTTTEAGRYLGKSPGEVLNDIRYRRLIAYRPKDGAKWRLPTWQFTGGKPHSWVSPLIEAYDKNDQALMKFLAAERDDGMCYAHCLTNGLSGRVILAARQSNKW